MKKIILLITLFASSLLAEIEFMKYKDALIKAKEEDKVVMVMLSREGCPACEYMIDIVFENDNVIDEFNKDFIGVYLDIHDDYIPSDFSFIGTPTFHFVNKSERKLDRIDGGVNAKDFTIKMREVKLNK